MAGGRNSTFVLTLRGIFIAYIAHRYFKIVSDYIEILL